MPGNYQITAVAAPRKDKKGRPHGARLIITVRDGQRVEGQFEGDGVDILHWAVAQDTVNAIGQGYEEYGLMNLEHLFENIERKDIADARAD